MPHDFSQQELACEFLTDEVWDEGMHIMCDAHVAAENFDRTLPHTKSQHGDAEVACWCKVDSDRHAKEMYLMAEAELKELGMDSKDRAQLRQRVASMSSEAQAKVSGARLLPLNPRPEPYSGPWPPVEQF